MKIKTDSTQMCFTVSTEISEMIDTLSHQLGISRSCFLRRGTIEFLNFHRDTLLQQTESNQLQGV